jgi:hypothetical protein
VLNDFQRMNAGDLREALRAVPSNYEVSIVDRQSNAYEVELVQVQTHNQRLVLIQGESA